MSTQGSHPRRLHASRPTADDENLLASLGFGEAVLLFPAQDRVDRTMYGIGTDSEDGIAAATAVDAKRNLIQSV